MAYGVYGGFALYKSDISEDMPQIPQVEEVTVIPRKMPMVPESLPKVRFLQEAIGGKARYVRGACRIAEDCKEGLTLGRLDIQHDWGWVPEYVEAI